MPGDELEGTAKGAPVGVLNRIIGRCYSVEDNADRKGTTSIALMLTTFVAQGVTEAMLQDVMHFQEHAAIAAIAAVVCTACGLFNAGKTAAAADIRSFAENLKSEREAGQDEGAGR